MILYYNNAKLGDLAWQVSAIVPECDCNLSLSDDEIIEQCYLKLTEKGLWIYSNLFTPFNLLQFYQDFITKRLPNIYNELLIQAIKLKSTKLDSISVLDMTAGLGRDSILMSLAKFRVTMLENNPYLALILNYLRIIFVKQIPNLELSYINNSDYLTSSTAQYDVIYLDPMFNDNKQAKPKKEMQLIDLLINASAGVPDVDPYKLLGMCQSHCSNRLIIKRDNKQAKFIQQPLPTCTKSGKTVRFDVYQF